MHADYQVCMHNNYTAKLAEIRTYTAALYLVHVTQYYNITTHACSIKFSCTPVSPMHLEVYTYSY